jgi:iron-sulfur cluster assembly accessory protein
MERNAMATENNFPIQLTQNAINMAKAVREESKGEDGDILRISVQGGGCAGYQYGLTFVKDSEVELEEADVMADMDGLRVVVDAFSVNMLNGCVVDYVESADGAGFKFDHPGAKRTCGCGSSFSA